MRVSSPSSASRAPAAACALATAGTVAFLLLIVILVTGGISFDAGPLHVSARNWSAALIAFLILSAAALAVARGDGRQLFARLHAGLVARSTSVAVLIAASAAGVGIAFGTYAASASDASGYINQASSIARGSLVLDEPLARSLDWPDATTTFAPLGYRAGDAGGELVPTYPTGLPLVLAGAQRLAGDTGMFLVVPLFGAAAVFATYRLGVRWHSREAGLAAAVMLATSPIFLFQLVQPMSDVPVTCWWALAYLFASGVTTRAWVAAGVAAGLAVMTRPNLAPLAVVVALLPGFVMPAPEPSSSRNGALPRFVRFYSAGFLLPLIALLLIQWRLYGSPFSSGYGSLGELFGAAAVGPNLAAYTSRIVRGELPSLCLAGFGAIVVALTRARPDAAPKYGAVAPAAWAAIAVAVTVVACYLPYAVFSEWFYLRFLLPAFPPLFVIAGSLAAGASRRLPSSAGLLVLLATLTLAASFNIQVADREQAFRMRDYEARYRLAGRYLDAALPPNVVLLAVQESGSARYYTRLPVLRWDLLSGDLDSALADLTARGRRPILLIEDPEAEALRARFPGSNAARLQWAPRATIAGATTTVRVFDPADRSQSGSAAHDIVR